MKNNSSDKIVQAELFSYGIEIPLNNAIAARDRIFSFAKQKLEIALSNFSISDIIRKNEEFHEIVKTIFKDSSLNEIIPDFLKKEEIYYLLQDLLSGFIISDIKISNTVKYLIGCFLCEKRIEEQKEKRHFMTFEHVFSEANPKFFNTHKLFFHSKYMKKNVFLRQIKNELKDILPYIKIHHVLEEFKIFNRFLFSKELETLSFEIIFCEHNYFLDKSILTEQEENIFEQIFSDEIEENKIEEKLQNFLNKDDIVERIRRAERAYVYEFLYLFLEKHDFIKE